MALRCSPQNLRDHFPHPYTAADADAWVALAGSQDPASLRVLEKAGYVREAVLRRGVLKDGQVLDAVLYANTEPPSMISGS